MHYYTNLLIRPLHANFLNSVEYFASHGTEVWLGGTKARQNMLHQELLHASFDIRMSHDERCKADSHVESAILLRSLGIRAQDVVNKAENWHESYFRSALHQLDEEARCSNERSVEVVTIICKVVSLKYTPEGVEASLPTCWRTRSTGSECQSSSLTWVKDN